MLSYASHIIESFDDMETQLKNWDSAGTLRIGSSISTGTQMLPQLVRRFNLRFPQIRTQVLIDNSRIIEDKVLTNQLDLALVESLSYSPDIVCVPFYTDRLIVITAPKHPLTQNPECTVKALADYPVLLREPGSGTGRSSTPCWSPPKFRSRRCGKARAPVRSSMPSRRTSESRFCLTSWSKTKFKAARSPDCRWPPRCPTAPAASFITATNT